VRYAWIQVHRSDFPVTAMCHALKVSRSGFYDWRDRRPGPRAMRRARLYQAVALSHARSHQIYGQRKVQEDLLAEDDTDLHCCQTTVERIMRELGLRGRPKKKYVCTTQADAFATPAPNVLERDFTAKERDQKWVADITYIQTGEGWLYLAAVLDLYSRRVVGWATSERIDADLVCTAMRNALQTRRPGQGLIHHSDRGSQYTSESFQDLLDTHGVECSMSRKGDPWDNAPMESFLGSLKREWVRHRKYATRADAHADLFQYIEVFYNRQRRHAALGYKSPVAFEEDRAA